MLLWDIVVDSGFYALCLQRFWSFVIFLTCFCFVLGLEAVFMTRL